MNRRQFLQSLGIGTGLGCAALASPALRASEAGTDDDAILRRIDAHRPSRLKTLPAGFRARVGAAHVAGRYHLTDKPFLIEGAEKLLSLGTRLGKFWFMPSGAARDYPFNSRWPECKTLTDLARTEYFQQVFALPFETFILEAPLPSENLAKVTEDFHELTAQFYRIFRDRAVTVILQNWEGDWLLRGRGGATWNPPPADWKSRCERMCRQLAARQEGIAKARAEHGKDAKCRVAHAAEVNRVADLWKGIPTMTEHVLPEVELDLVSYSAYDGMKDGLTLWKCIAEIQRRARTTGLFGKNAVFVGEIGLPENEQPARVAERWDEWLGVMLAAELPYLAMWELYCNELNPKRLPPPAVPVKNADDLRGFWLVRPDGSLSETGKFFSGLWQRP